MPRDRTRSGPSLPKDLLRQIGVESKLPGGRRFAGNDRRDAHRVTKRPPQGGLKSRPVIGSFTRDREDAESRFKQQPTIATINRKREIEDESSDESLGGAGDFDEDEDMSGDDDDDEEDDSDDDETPPKPAVSKTVREKLAQEDKEIAELERKLGLKGRKGLPKSFKDDGLGDLLEDIDGAVTGEAQERKKRKSEADEWLAQKRRKAAASQTEQESESDEEDEDDDVEDLDLDDDKDDDERNGEGDFEGFDSEPESAPAPKPKRENPYVAPSTGVAVAKYIPPSLREKIGSDAELISRIRRQTQGLVNKLTEANLVSILGEVEKLYREHPRQHVTSILTDLLLVQICDLSSLPDTMMILTAGFATAAYKVIGMDFGAYLVQSTVEKFKEHYERTASRAKEGLDLTKEPSNLITFITEMYNFQLIGCDLVFDHIRLLLEELTELNAELLLRIVRLSGKSLRHDDPMALKDIVSLIRPAVERTGEQKLSVRTKFMIETINDLKNNKMKAGASASAVVTEHTTRMKKVLGSLNTRKLKATEPLRMGLKDIEQADKRGKWWLVGSSWAGNAKSTDGNKAEDVEDGQAPDDDIMVDRESSPDPLQLAREQGMNTDVRRAIFVAIVCAVDFEDAYRRLLKLRLNKEQRREIPLVILQCAGGQADYNPYYALVARKVCGDVKIKWGFQDALWKMFRRMGVALFGEERGDDADDGEPMELRRIVHTAKVYGRLVAEGVLGLQILKCLELVYLRESRPKALVEVLLVTALVEAEAVHGKGASEAVRKMFEASGEELARGLQYFLRKVVRKSDLAGGKKETKVLKRNCRIAEDTLEGVLGKEV